MVAQPSQSHDAEASAETDLAEGTAIEQILAKLQHFSPARQQQVLDFVEFLDQKTQPKESEKGIWDVLDEAAASIPSEERAKMPPDGSYQHDHYLYGTPKREV